MRYVTHLGVLTHLFFPLRTNTVLTPCQARCGTFTLLPCPYNEYEHPTHSPAFDKFTTSYLYKKRIAEVWYSQRFCDSAGIQTQDLQNRNLTLYSAKLRSLVGNLRRAKGGWLRRGPIILAGAKVSIFFEPAKFRFDSFLLLRNAVYAGRRTSLWTDAPETQQGGPRNFPPCSREQESLPQQTYLDISLGTADSIP